MKANWMAALVAAVFFGVAQPALAAVNVVDANVSYEETANVNNQELKLNGAGVRYKAIFKVYALGLYLSENKKSSEKEVVATRGPKRFALILLRDMSNNELGNGFLKTVRDNLDNEERAKISSPMFKLGEIFSHVPELAKGSSLTIDLDPVVGLIASYNGKILGEAIPDQGLCDAVMKIWLGEHPVDTALKRALLGQKAEERRGVN